MATYSSSSVGVTRLVLRRTPPPLASCVATYSSSSGVGVTRLVLQRTPPPLASCVATYSSSSGVGVTRLVLQRTPPPPASCVATYSSSSGVFCCDVLLLRRWFHASGVATYPFSHVKSTRLLPLAGNPRHETQSIVSLSPQSLLLGVNHKRSHIPLIAVKNIHMPRMKNTIPSPFFVVSLFVARLR